MFPRRRSRRRRSASSGRAPRSTSSARSRSLVSITPSGDARRLSFEAPAALAPFIASKGSVAIDGVSLTVNDVSGTRFGVMLIPHTLSVTNLKQLRPGSRINLEVDVVARYVVRYLTATRELPAADPDASLRAALERAELI
jgi:riboflavin synthase alpha subunit